MSYMALGSSNHKVMLRVNYLAESNFQGKKKKKKEEQLTVKEIRLKKV